MSQTGLLKFARRRIEKARKLLLPSHLLDVWESSKLAQSVFYQLLEDSKGFL